MAVARGPFLQLNLLLGNITYLMVLMPAWDISNNMLL